MGITLYVSLRTQTDRQTDKLTVTSPLPPASQTGTGAVSQKGDVKRSYGSSGH